MPVHSAQQQNAARISPAQRAVEQRIANPLLRRLLQSRLHGLASRWVLLVSYEGRRSGRRYTFPVVYDRQGETLVVVTPSAESTWWRNFTSPYPCTVWVRGEARAAVGEVVTGDARGPLLATYFERYRVLGGVFGYDPDDAAAPDSADDIAVGRFDLDRD